MMAVSLPGLALSSHVAGGSCRIGGHCAPPHCNPGNASGLVRHLHYSSGAAMIRWQSWSVMHRALALESTMETKGSHSNVF